MRSGRSRYWAGAGRREVARLELTAIVKLQPAIRTMIEFATTQPGQQVPNALLHAIDLIPAPQLSQSGSTTLRAAADVPAVKWEVRREIEVAAIPAKISRGVEQSLYEGSFDAR
jgi:hypothetical protein